MEGIYDRQLRPFRAMFEGWFGGVAEGVLTFVQFQRHTLLLLKLNFMHRKL